MCRNHKIALFTVVLSAVGGEILLLSIRVCHFENARFLQWPPLLDDISIKSEAIDFYHCLEDNFLA